MPGRMVQELQGEEEGELETPRVCRTAGGLGPWSFRG